MSHQSLIIARNICKSYNGRSILNNINLTASSKQRIGLIGENGAGKSTLLRILAGIEETDQGTIERPKDCGFLRQQLEFAANTSIQAVIDNALSKFHTVQTRLDCLSCLIENEPDNIEYFSEYSELLHFAEIHDLWGVEHRAEHILANIGLANIDSSRSLESLSGGQQSRLGLAALLIKQPQALLLDEPTNHLDDDAIAFVEDYLNKLSGTVIIASHDRVFLDRVCTDIIDIDPAREGIMHYSGRYSDYLTVKKNEQILWQQHYALEQNMLKKLRYDAQVTARNINHGKTIKDNNKLAYDRAGGRVEQQISRRVRNVQNRLEDLQQKQIRKPPEKLHFSANITQKTKNNTSQIIMKNVKIFGRLEIDHLNIMPNSHAMITGSNGAGKSTLLKLCAGKIKPDSGDIIRDKNLRIGLLEQDIYFKNLHKTARQYYDKIAKPNSIQLAHLGLLPLATLDRPVVQLSIGQQRRLALALLIANPPDILLLDEPSNHLSLNLVEELEDAIKTAPNTIIIATHDRWLRQRWDSEHIMLKNGRIDYKY